MKEIKIQIRGGSAESASPEYFFQNLPQVFEKYKFVVDDKPDYVFEYTKGSPPEGNFTKVLWAEEWMVPNLSKWDYVIGWQYEDQIRSAKYIRFTNYFNLGAGTDLIKPASYDVAKIAQSKTKFCNHVYYHYVPDRDYFMEELSKYKTVDAPGVCCNNCPPIAGHKSVASSRSAPQRWAEKVAWLTPYKFTIAFENRSISGYTSEKIYHAMLANSIPIYWGHADVRREFNTKSFINAGDCRYTNSKDIVKFLVDRVIHIDTDENAYLAMLREPWLPSNKLTPWLDQNRYVEFFDRMFSGR